MGNRKQLAKVLSSSVFKLFTIVIVVIVPLNVLILTFSKTTIKEVEKQIFWENENALKLCMEQLDGAIERIMDKIRKVVLNNADFRRLNGKDITNQKEYYQQIQSSVNLYNEYKTILEDHELIDGLLAYFPEKDMKLVQERESTSGRYIMEYTKNLIENTEYALFLNQWKGTVVNERPVIVYIGKYKNAYYGVWVDIKNFLNKISIEESHDLVKAFVDRQGNVIYVNSTKLNQEKIKELYQVQDNKAYMILEAKSENTEFSYVQLIAKSDAMRQLPVIISVLQILSICTLLAVPIVVVALRKWMVVPLDKLSEAMDKIEHGHMDFRIVEESAGSEYAQINHHFNQMMDKVENLNHRILDEQLKKKDIQMKFLSQQIQPHFILNAMDIIYSYEPEEYPLIQKMILCLSRYFRYVVNASKDLVELSKEMEHICNYLAIQHERYPDVFYSKVEYQPETAECLIPPLLIQSFAENVIKHSLNIDSKIDILINGRLTTDGKLCISLADTGDGISDDILDKIDRFKKTGVYQEGLGIGIQNSIERLKLKCGESSELIISRTEPHGTLVKIIIPVLRKGDIVDESDIGG